jgi:hypothetical protein
MLSRTDVEGGSPFRHRGTRRGIQEYRVAVNVVVACCRYVRARPEATTTREVVIKDVEVYRYLIN